MLLMVPVLAVFYLLMAFYDEFFLNSPLSKAFCVLVTFIPSFSAVVLPINYLYVQVFTSPYHHPALFNNFPFKFTATFKSGSIN
jgi:hypothetical protein